MAVAYCLNCGGRIYLGQRPWVGQAVFCDRCGADLEVTQVNPLDLDWTDALVPGRLNPVLSRLCLGAGHECWVAGGSVKKASSAALIAVAKGPGQ